MVFAVEACCPASDGISAARIEEEVVVASYGTEVPTGFPPSTCPSRARAEPAGG